jgi:hypothetical protein
LGIKATEYGGDRLDDLIVQRASSLFVLSSERELVTVFKQQQKHKIDRNLLHPIRSDRATVQPMYFAQPLSWSNQAGQQFVNSCPRALPGPALCPFGGACHACPARVQAKLSVSQPSDPYKQEANRVAEQVMSMPEPKVQRACQSCEYETLRKKPLAGQITPNRNHFTIQRQTHAPIIPSTRAQRIFSWLEAPLRAAVIHDWKIDKWNDNAISGLVLTYNKMRNEGVWQYVDEITHSSPNVSIDFLPFSGVTALRQQLPKHGYSDCMASWKLDWGLRKEKACGPHLHFKHFNSSDVSVNVHIDKIDPCCGVVPIIGRVISMLRHYHHDVRGWTKRNPQEFIKLLQQQKVPISAGTLQYLARKGYI